MFFIFILLQIEFGGGREFDNKHHCSQALTVYSKHYEAASYRIIYIYSCSCEIYIVSEIMKVLGYITFVAML